MRVTYAPEDGDKQTWEFHPGRVKRSEAVLIEKRAGVRWDEWVVLVKAEQVEALGILLWHLIRREHPALKFEDVPDFFIDEVDVELDLAELVEARGEVAKKSHLFTDDQLRGIFADIDAEIEDRKIRGEVELGKATSKNADADTNSTSPQPCT